MTKVDRIKTGRLEDERIQNRTQDAVSRLDQRINALGAEFDVLEGVALTTTDQRIRHRLGRAARGAVLIAGGAPGDLRATVPPAGQFPQNFITLRMATSAATVSVLVL